MTRTGAIPRHATGVHPTARRSPALVRFFGHWFAHYFVRHMNALRIARWGEPAVPPLVPPLVPTGAGPLVVYSNHPSWWDAAVYVLLSCRMFPAHAGFGPMDAAMLRKYPFFERIGVFGVEPGAPSGGVRFLAAAQDILAAPDRILWVAAQGRFADVRDRPLGLRPGIAHLPGIAPDALFLPLAIEYGFWTERGAEALVAFGPPIPGTALAALERKARLGKLETALSQTMDRLAVDARTRDPDRFRTILAGRRGVGGVYDVWRRVNAALSGRRFEPGHAPDAGLPP